MCSAACASSRFLRSEAYGGSFPTTPIPGCMSYWTSWALITGSTHGLQVRVSSERLEGRRLKKTTGSTGQGCEMVVKKELKEFYHASPHKVTVVDVPAFTYLMIDGAGDPNASPAYAQAVETLFAASYTAKFMVKRSDGGIDYTVMPLEGLWWADDWSAFETGDRARWQ